MALQPVGPLSASTYWWRRTLVFLGALLVLLLLGRACAGGSPTRPSAARGPASVSSPTPSDTASPPAGSGPTGASAAPSAGSSLAPAPATPAPIGTCPDSALQISVVSDAASYKAGAAPRFTLTVHNTSSVACQRALGPAAVELRVLSGQDRIWSSNDCTPTKSQGVLLLPAGAARATTVQWPGKRTKPGCQLGATAQPGTYVVSARIGDIVRQGSVFQVTR